jgi:hypothetical protein
MLYSNGRSGTGLRSTTDIPSHLKMGAKINLEFPPSALMRMGGGRVSLRERIKNNDG